MSAIKYWVWLSALPVEAKLKQRLLERFSMEPMGVYYATDQELKAVDGVNDTVLERFGRRELDTAMDILSACEEEGLSIITYQDADYPVRLKNIYDPPVALYVKGQLPAIDEEPAIAVIGTRHNTPYGEKMARRMGYQITKCGGLVISGLTQGIDRFGAEGALQASGRVVGVLGTGHDLAHNRLCDDVAAAGALVSEYPPGVPGTRANFRQRNRLTSGLSAGVVVVEAPEKSGALLFVEDALSQGREVFAVPGNADADNSVGTNRLIQEGAKAVSTGWDVLCELEGLFRGKLKYPGQERMTIPQEPQARDIETGEDFFRLRQPSDKKVIDKKNSKEYIDLEKLLADLSPSQQNIVRAIYGGAAQVDEIVAATGLAPSAVLPELTMLQIDGVIREESGKQFALNIME